MLKLNASYSKKVPAEGEYSSQSFYASVEVELPDGLTAEQLNSKIRDTFKLVKESVEIELAGLTTAAADAPERGCQSSNPGPAQNDVPASGKQLKYLLDLARAKGVTPQQIAGQFNVQDIRQLTRSQCSKIIDEWRAA